MPRFFHDTCAMRRSSSAAATLPTLLPGSAPLPNAGLSTVRKLLPYVWQWRWRVALALACLVAAKLSNIGVPLVLKGNTTATFGTAPTWSKGSAEPASISSAFALGMTPVYLIERMCTAAGDALVGTCIVNGRAQTGGTIPRGGVAQLFPPMYRITARVTGPRNTVSYVQAIFSLREQL